MPPSIGNGMLFVNCDKEFSDVTVSKGTGKLFISIDECEFESKLLSIFTQPL